MKKLIASILTLCVLALPLPTFADAAVGDTVVTIGANLNEAQKQQVIDYFHPPEQATYITVTIDEERHYLGNSVPAAQIGNGTHSCAMVTHTQKGSGVRVQTNNINYVTESAYASALTTAGITDADVQVTAPFEVSGTGALTGILKAYETSTGTAVNEEVKQAATQELVTNADLAQSIGEKDASQVVNDVKKEFAEQGTPQTPEEVKAIADKVLAENNINLTDEQYQKLLNLIDEFSKLDVNWDKVAKEATKIAAKAQDFLNSEDGQNFLDQLGNWLNQLVDWMKSVFGGSENNN